jgi:hypothetical protein
MAFMVFSRPGKLEVDHCRQRKMGKIEKYLPSACKALAHLVTWVEVVQVEGTLVIIEGDTFFQPEETLECVLAARALGIRAKKVLTKTEESTPEPSRSPRMWESRGTLAPDCGRGGQRRDLTSISAKGRRQRSSPASSEAKRV